VCRAENGDILTDLREADSVPMPLNSMVITTLSAGDIVLCFLKTYRCQEISRMRSGRRDRLEIDDIRGLALSACPRFLSTGYGSSTCADGVGHQITQMSLKCNVFPRSSQSLHSVLRKILFVAPGDVRIACIARNACCTCVPCLHITSRPCALFEPTGT